MKNKNIKIGAMSLLAFMLLSCEDDTLSHEGNNNGKITVAFEAVERELNENGLEETLVLQFNKPLPSDAIITLLTDDAFDDRITSVPPSDNGFIRIPVLKGQNTTQIKLRPVDNTQKDGDLEVDLTLHDLPSQFIGGINKSLRVTIKDDESTLHAESVANFVLQDIVLKETSATAVEYQIHLSEAVAVESQIRITSSSEKARYDTHYTTEPLAQHDTVTLQVAPGSKVVAFKVKAVGNAGITGDLKIIFTIAQTTGSIRKGNNVRQTLTIKDDELAQKPKGYEVTAGSTVLKKFYEYDEQGRVSKVNWETYTSFYSRGTDTYVYDSNNRLEKINKHAFKDILYHWSNGQIIRSEEVVDGVVKSYTDYEYDESGNVGGVASYHRQADGNFAKGFFTVYLYFTDGNLYKSLTYQPTADPEEPFLVSAKTYENYIDVANPFSMTEILPTVKAQTKLATSYHVEEAGMSRTYHMVYEYRPDGLPEKRIATAPGDTQTAVYHYY